MGGILQLGRLGSLFREGYLFIKRARSSVGSVSRFRLQFRGGSPTPTFIELERLGPLVELPRERSGTRGALWLFAG